MSAQGVDERMMNVHYYYYYEASTTTVGLPMCDGVVAGRFHVTDDSVTACCPLGLVSNLRPAVIHTGSCNTHTHTEWGRGGGGRGGGGGGGGRREGRWEEGDGGR